MIFNICEYFGEVMIMMQKAALTTPPYKLKRVKKTPSKQRMLKRQCMKLALLMRQCKLEFRLYLPRMTNLYYKHEVQPIVLFTTCITLHREDHFFSKSSWEEVQNPFKVFLPQPACLPL